MDIVVRGLNGLLMIGLPLALGAILTRRLQRPWRVFGAGALTFLASQAVHLPFNLAVLNPFLVRLGLGSDPRGGALVTAAVLLGLSAGVCEEGARVLAYRLWLRKVRTWEEGVLFGVGHGGLEAVLLGALALFGLAQAIAYRDADLARFVPAGQVAAAQTQLAAYWAGPWYLALLGAWERASALGIQIALAVVVLQAFVRRQPAWIAVAVGWHALVDASAVLALQAWGPLATEALVTLLAGISLAAAFALRPTPPPPDRAIPAEPPVWPGGRGDATDGRPDPAALDSSRFLE